MRFGLIRFFSAGIAGTLLLLFNDCSTSTNRNVQQENRTFEKLEYIGQLQPKHSKDIKASYWGIQASTLDPQLLERAAEIGVKWTRLNASWNDIEKERGKYDWSKTDKAFDAILKTGITPFVTIGHGNTLYSKLSTYDDPRLAEIYGYKPEPPVKDPAAMEAWLKFVELTIKRYKNKIAYWEVWNEPNHRNYWGATPDGLEYGRLLKQTAELIKKIQPEAKVIGGSTAGIQPEFTDEFLSVGTAGLIDIITYHNYGSVPEERAYRAVKLWEVIDKYNPKIELWQGECGYPSHSSTRDFRGRAPWGLKIQAKWLLRQAFTDVFFCNAAMSNYFKLVHSEGRMEWQQRSPLKGLDTLFGYRERGGSRVRTKGVNEKCLLSNPEFIPKPGYFAYQNLCAIMDNSYKIFRAEHKIHVENQGDFYGIGEEDDAFPSITLVASFKTEENKNLIAYWLPWNAQENIMHAANILLAVENVNFTDPVLVDLLSGNAYKISAFAKDEKQMHFKDLPLLDYPLCIVDRDAIMFK
ncbi:MAG: hypothetical protein MI975_16160 [Cytophagales bacterium]|nr:hypothetical protein [Cytophagales bacterium]